LETSLDTINEAIEQHKPIHALLGFSQGATMAALYLSSAGKGDDDGVTTGGGHLQDIRLALIVSGFLPRDKSYAEVITAVKPSIPTLFVVGEQDELVREEKSAELWANFKIKGVYRHKGSHFVPTCSGEYKTAVIKFLDEHGKKRE
jgi:predicted esterase